MRWSYVGGGGTARLKLEELLLFTGMHEGRWAMAMPAAESVPGKYVAAGRRDLPACLAISCNRTTQRLYPLQACTSTPGEREGARQPPTPTPPRVCVMVI